jgi:hypothetical protein
MPFFSCAWGCNSGQGMNSGANNSQSVMVGCDIDFTLLTLEFCQANRYCG